MGICLRVVQVLCVFAVVHVCLSFDNFRYTCVFLVVVECQEDQVQLGHLATVSFVRPSRCKPIVEDRRKVNPLLMDQCKCLRTDFFCKMLQITAIVVTIISWWLLGKELLASNPTNHSVSPKKLVTNLLLNVVIFISHVQAIHHSSICKLVPYNHRINYYSVQKKKKKKKYKGKKKKKKKKKKK